MEVLVLMVAGSLTGWIGMPPKQTGANSSAVSVASSLRQFKREDATVAGNIKAPRGNKDGGEVA